MAQGPQVALVLQGGGLVPSVKYTNMPASEPSGEMKGDGLMHKMRMASTDSKGIQRGPIAQTGKEITSQHIYYHQSSAPPGT
jgi:hypothetical protein